MWAAELTIDAPQLGDLALDDEHQQLLGRLCLLYEALLGQFPPREQRVVLHEFAMFVRVNCQHEEALMCRYEYPLLAAHRDRHHNISRRIGWMEHSLIRSGPQAAVDVLREMASDIVHHIDQEDRDFVTWLHSDSRMRSSTAIS